MKLQQLNKYLLVVLLFLVSAASVAGTKWEVATVFLGEREGQDFQKDVDRNIIELSTLIPSESLKLGLYREMPEKTYSYFPHINVPADKEASLGELTSSGELAKYKIPGQYTKSSREELLLHLKNSFKDPSSKKMLVLYGHGVGPLGMKDMQVNELTSLLSELNIKIDVLWFDACFLSNIEFLFQLRKFSDYTIASEEAEFTSGLPFEFLSELPTFSKPKEAALFLAKRFIESYSYIKNGRQKKYVSTSSATISVIENSQIEPFTNVLAKVPKIIRQLPANIQASLAKGLAKNKSMDNNELVDLGHLAIKLKQLNKDPEADDTLGTLIRLLNIHSLKKLKTNPRIKIEAPAENAQLIFGFNNWENGAMEEYKDNPVFSSILSAKSFTEGPRGEEWPVRTFHKKSMTISPFAPGINSFDYYFTDASGKAVLSLINSFHRTHDIVEDVQEENEDQKATGSLLLYTAYTQQVGTKAEKYTGMNISLFNTTPSFDYFEMEFNQKVKWLKL